MVNKKNILVILFIILICSCKKELNFKVVDKHKISGEIKLPDNLITELSKIFVKQNPSLSLTVEDVKTKFGFYKVFEWPFSLKVWSKKSQGKIARDYKGKSGVLSINLNSFIKTLGEEEEFYFKMNLLVSGVSKPKVFFLPSYSEDKVCNKFFDISTFYKEKLLEKVLLTRDDDQYVKNYLGTYVFFSVLSQDSYQLNIVKLTDSKFEKKLCKHF